MKARRVAFAAMLLVGAWSLWAWAQPSSMPVRPTQASAAPEATEEPPPINWGEFGKETPPFVAMVVNFGILVAGYYLLFKKPITLALENRRDSISKEIDEAQKMKLEAQARAKTYQAKLDTLEEETKTAREALVRAGEAERDRLVAEAEAKAERMRKDAEFLVEQELKQIRLDLWRDALDSAVAAAEELIKRRVTSADQERFAEDYLADLGGKPRGERAEALRPAEPGARTPS
jgi:F0F1-type ATP synthase membrane subunit b/b'